MYFGDQGKKIIEHVRRPALPWRSTALTECGLSVEGPSVLTREEFLRKVKDQGIQRAMLTTCYTCGETAQRHPDWQKNPAGCLARETGMWGHGKRVDLLNREMRAIEALVSRHREEFEELMRDVIEVVSLDEERKARARGGRPPVRS